MKIFIILIFTLLSSSSFSSSAEEASNKEASIKEALIKKENSKYKSEDKYSKIKNSTNSKPSAICTGTFSNLLSPFCTEARPFLIYGSLLTTGLYISRANTSNKVRVASLRERPLRNASYIGDAIGYGYLNVAYVLGHALWGKMNSAELMAEASIYTGIVTWGLKQLVNEPRPGNNKDTQSFPSGHASMAFAFASVVGVEHGWEWGTVAYATALFISFSRIQDDYHYLHDVIFGATLGLSYGLGIHYNHKRGHPYWFMPAPTADGKGAQVIFKVPIE